MSLSIIRSEEEKIEMLQKHFYYEFGMLNIAKEIMQSSFNTEKLNLNKESISLDLFIVHGRSLLEFFYRKPKRKDRPWAQEFLKEGKSWEVMCQKKTELMNKLQRQADEDVMHLSYKRARKIATDRNWDMTLLFQDFQKLVIFFLSHVKEQYIHESLKSLAVIGTILKTEKPVDISLTSTSTDNIFLNSETE